MAFWLFLLGLLFVALKVGGQVDWSWLWVTAPFWAGPAYVAAMAALLLAIAAAVACAAGIGWLVLAACGTVRRLVAGCRR